MEKNLEKLKDECQQVKFKRSKLTLLRKQVRQTQHLQKQIALTT